MGRPYARCARVLNSGDCDNTHRYHLDDIENAVLTGLREELQHPDAIKTAQRAYHDEWAKLSRNRGRERLALEKRLQDVVREARRLIDMVAKGQAEGAQVGGRITELDREEQKLERRLGEAQAGNIIALHPRAVDRYIAAVENLQATLASGADFLPAATELRGLIDHIVVDRSELGVQPVIEIIGRLAALAGIEREGVCGGGPARPRGTFRAPRGR